MSAGPSVSVVIPTYGVAPHLADVVRSLRAQTVPPKEIVVAHSGDSDPSPWLHDPGNGVVVLHSDERWLPGAARNAGAAIAAGTFLAFLDCDIIAEKTWLEGFLRTARQQIGRQVLIGSLDHGAGDTYWGRCLWFIESGSVHPYRAGHFMASAPGANLLLQRETLESAGGFPSDVLVGEDALFSANVREQGGRLLFVPGARGAHQYAREFRQVMQKLFALGEGAAQIRLVQSLPGSLAARVPPLALGLWLVRLAQISKRVIERRGPVLKLLSHSPGLLLGLVFWTLGFFKGALAGPAARHHQGIDNVERSLETRT